MSRREARGLQSQPWLPPAVKAQCGGWGLGRGASCPDGLGASQGGGLDWKQGLLLSEAPSSTGARAQGDHAGGSMEVAKEGV